MQIQDVFQTIESLYPTYLTMWEEVCRIESPTDCKPGVDAVGDYFAALAASRGWQVDYLRNEVAGNALCITLNPSVAAAPISLSGHMDTVHAVGSFGTPAVHTDEQHIYGPGVTDCKGGLIAGLMAMDALDRCGYRRRPVQLLLQSDEEVSSLPSGKATIRYICEKAKNSVAFLNLEPHTPSKACVARKGIADLTFTVTGAQAHAAKCAEEGANAIADAAYKIIELEKLKDPDGLTCNCGIITGGTASNTVPDRCQFQANVRFATAKQLEWVLEYAKTLANTVHVPDCTCTLEVPQVRVAMELTDRNTALLERMNAAFQQCGLPPLQAAKRPAASDAADVTAAGIPCVDSIGVVGEYIHSPREYAVKASLKEAAQRIAAVVCHL